MLSTLYRKNKKNFPNMQYLAHNRPATYQSTDQPSTRFRTEIDNLKSYRFRYDVQINFATHSKQYKGQGLSIEQPRECEEIQTAYFARTRETRARTSYTRRERTPLPWQSQGSGSARASRGHRGRAGRMQNIHIKEQTKVKYNQTADESSSASPSFRNYPNY